MTSNFKKIPAFTIQYYEYEKQIESLIELYKNPIIIDGFFDPNTKEKISLGYYVHLKRKPETLKCLINAGLGVHLFRNNKNFYCAESKSPQSIYILLKNNSEEQIILEPGKTIELYDLAPIFKHKMLPKKVGKMYDEYTIKISFGSKFEKRKNIYVSPCWCELNLNRIVDEDSD